MVFSFIQGSTPLIHETFWIYPNTTPRELFLILGIHWIVNTGKWKFTVQDLLEMMSKMSLAEEIDHGSDYGSDI